MLPTVIPCPTQSEGADGTRRCYEADTLRTVHKAIQERCAGLSQADSQGADDTRVGSADLNGQEPQWNTSHFSCEDAEGRAVGLPSRWPELQPRLGRPIAIRWAFALALRSGRRRAITGICARSIQPRIDAALEGHVDISDVVDAVQPRPWDLATVLPIFQDTTIVASGPERADRRALRGAGRHCGRRRALVKTPQRGCT